MIAKARWVTLAAALAVATVGCGTTATIKKTNGADYELEIVRSTPSELIVATRDGERPIPRNEIREIDHPGNVSVTAGVALFFAGTANLFGAFRCDTYDARSQRFCAGWGVGGGMAVTGLGMIIWGSIIWKHSVRAAGGQQGAPVVWLVPALLPASDRWHPGALLALSF
ncbi:MAG: hypothetical protein ACJ8F1_17745 [Polyangia bacterium]